MSIILQQNSLNIIFNLEIDVETQPPLKLTSCYYISGADGRIVRTNICINYRTII